MKRNLLVLAVAALALTACNSKPTPHHTITATASAAASNEVAIAKGTAQGCLQKGSVFTHAGRVLIKNCITGAVPVANARPAEACAASALLLSGAPNRQNGLASCLVKYGKPAK